MSNDQDFHFVQACLAGDRKAFGMLVDKYEKKLFNVALRVVDDYEDAMDATQSAFVKAYEKLDTFDPSYRFFSWLYRILLNESLNIVNRRKRYEKIDDRDIGVAATNPEDEFRDTHTGEVLMSALKDLKPDYRAVVVLKHYLGLSYREMSDIVGVPEKTIKSRLFSARRELKGLLTRRGIER